MLQVRVEHVSITPLLVNPATDQLLEELRTRTTSRKDPTKSAYDEAKEKLYIEDGVIGIPAINYFSCLVEAGRFGGIKTGDGKQVSTKESTVLPAFLTIEDTFFPFPDDCQTWEVDKRRGRNPKDGVMVCITRPKFRQWRFSVTLLIDDGQINEKVVRRLVALAGKRVGLCDFRPACRGNFGMFRVAKWEVLNRWKEEDEFAIEDAESVLQDGAPRKRSKKAVSAAIAGAVSLIGAVATKAYVSLVS